MSRSATGITKALRACAPVAVLAAAIALALGPLSSARAVTVEAPTDSPRSVGVTVTLEATDPTGTVLLSMDGRVVRTAPATPGSSVVMTGVPAVAGLHRVRATLRSPEGLVRSVNQLLVRVWGIPGKPRMMNPASGVAGRSVAVRVKAGSSTSSMTLTFNGRFVKTVACAPGQSLAMGTVSMPSGVSTFKITSANPFGQVATYSFRVRRTSFPWATCIIVDKSERRLYWVRNGVLVKTYRVAIGKASTPTPVATWKVGMKHKTDPRGVYGPRKLRLFRKSGSTFVYTNYGIHGTNEPWVIGTMASHGCIRMYNREILELWPQVPVGTMVQTRN